MMLPETATTAEPSATVETTMDLTPAELAQIQSAVLQWVEFQRLEAHERKLDNDKLWLLLFVLTVIGLLVFVVMYAMAQGVA